MQFSKAVVKYRIPILILTLVLMIPSILGMAMTRVNYDMLTYLPEDMETVIGQNELLEDFNKGAFTFLIFEDMPSQDVAALKAEVEKIEHVDTVLWYDSLTDLSVPMALLPDALLQEFNTEHSTMMAVFFDSGTSEDETMDAVKEIRKVCGEQCFVSGMTALVVDLKDLCEQEEPIYVGLAVTLACAAMLLFLDGWLIPFVFLASIGAMILLNMGSNIFFGEISYITKALSAVLQLAVTMDYSIFLWHSYNEQRERCSDNREAMSMAISETLTSVIGSSITTVSGFIALCFMSFTLGRDLGLVMAKGVLLGVLGCVTVLPAMILVLDKPLQKTKHRSIIPNMQGFAEKIVKVFPAFLVVFALLVAPSLYGYEKANDEVYYDMGQCLPEDMNYVIANSKLREDFNIASTHMVLVDAGLSPKAVRSMMDEMEQVDGVKYVLGLESVVGSRVPQEILPDSVKGILESDRWELLLINSEYAPASDKVNSQIAALNDVLKSYDAGGMIIGEAPCLKDMIETTDHDFAVVTAVSVAAIFVIILLVEKSLSLPLILIAVIELGIFINLGLPHYLGQSMAFITPICISTIQLGATVDYAILMTTRYKAERIGGKAKKEAVWTALYTSIPSILVSGMGMFAATFGVALYSDIEIVSSMCMLMARGAVISMLLVVFVLPAMFMLFDRLICKTTLDMRSISCKKSPRRHSIMNKWTKKLTALGLCAALSLTFVTGAAAQANSKALSLRSTQAAQTAQTGAYKDETVYILADADGTVQNVIVSDWLQNPSGSSRLSDRSDLTDIENVKGDESFTENGSEKVWDAQGKDVYYQGSSDQALPVGLTVSYKLDGKDISAGELAGKSGRVTIRFDYENRQYELRKINGKQEKIYVPFAMLTGLLLDSDSFRNVEVVNGKLLNDGDHMIVAGLAFPGMQENLALEKDKLDIPDYVEITADAENFELGMTVTLASGSLFSALSTEDLDDADLSDALDKLTDAMTQLTDGSSALYEGLCTLLEKSGELTDGISQLGDGAKALKDGTDTLKAGTNELYAGTAELADGLGTLSENSASLNNGAAQVFNTLLSTATAQIREAGISVPNLTIGNYASVLTEVIASLDKDAVYQQALETVTAAVEAQRPAIETAVTAAVREKVEAQVTAAVQAEVQSGVTAAVQEQVAGQVILTATGMDRESYEAAVENGLVDAETQAAVEAAIQAQLASDSVQNQIETLTSTKMASDEIQSTISKTTDAQMQSADVQASIQQNVELQVTKAISDAMASDEVQAQLAAASEGAKSIIALKTSLDSYNTFYLGLLTYTEGVDTAAEGAYELLAGTRELQDGAVQLQEGAAELYNGVLTLQESVPALTDGVTQLRDGAKELADGLEQFREEVVQKLLDAADGDLSELTDRLEAIVETARGYRNFSGIADGMDGQVKFVYRTDEIKAD